MSGGRTPERLLYVYQAGAGALRPIRRNQKARVTEVGEAHQRLGRYARWIKDYRYGRGGLVEPGQELSVDQLLEEQERGRLRATVARIGGHHDAVEVTPWIRGGGCACHSSLRVPKEAIAGAVATGESHRCCGKTLLVVELTFRERTWGDAFAQLSERYQARPSRGARPLMYPGNQNMTWPPVFPQTACIGGELWGWVPDGDEYTWGALGISCHPLPPPPWFGPPGQWWGSY
jgi:hypothetical protein